MHSALDLVGLALLACGVLATLLSWLDFGRARRSIEWRLFEVQWGELARYGGPALACSGAIISFLDPGV